MSAKEQNFNTIGFVDVFGVPIYAIDVAASKTTVQNMIEEFKFKYDLKKLSPAHIEHFINLLNNSGIKTRTIAQTIEWK